MKNLITLFFLFLFFPVLAQAKNILDYYKQLPEEYFACDNNPLTTLETRLKVLEVTDIKNGYLQFNYGEMPREVALFKNKKTGQDVLVVSISCGAGCMCNKFDALIQDQNGAWRNLNKEVLPSFYTDRDAQNIFYAELSKKFKHEVFPGAVLPRQGTVIDVKDTQSGILLYQLKWDEDKFKKN